MPTKLGLYRLRRKLPVFEPDNGIGKWLHHLFRSEPTKIATVGAGRSGGMLLCKCLEVRTFSEFCDQHPDRTVVVYANTSAAVKARSDWVVTSSIAKDVVAHLHVQGKKVLFAPDRHLGHYIQSVTGADMLIWDGACIVHEEFKADGVRHLMVEHPEAAVLVHPESPAAVIELADRVGSTSQIVQAAREMPNRIFIVATDQGIFHTMQKAVPDKELIIAPTAGHGATCYSCANCPWMAMNELEALAAVFERDDNEVFVDPELGRRAMLPLQRMLDFKKTL